MIRIALLVLTFSVCSIYAEVDKNCTDSFKSTLQTLSDLVKILGPQKILGLPATEFCNFTIASNLELMKDKDVITVRNSSQVSSTFFLHLSALHIECRLELDENPANIPKFLLESEKEAPRHSCPQEDRQDVAKEVKSDRDHTMHLKDMLQLDECRPVGGNDKTKNAKNRGLIHIQWKNVNVKLETVVKTGTTKVHINQVDILNMNNNTIDIKCMGNIPEFVRSCKCFVATKFFVTFVTHVIDFILPCRLDEKKDDVTLTIVDYFVCPED